MRSIHMMLLLALLPGVAGAQVYKCKGRNGESVYSQDPCDGNTTPMALKVSKPASPGGNDGAGSSSGSAMDYCVANASAVIYGPSNDRVATLQERVAALQQQAIAEPGNANVRGQIASLQQSIARERASATAQLSTARRRCADENAAPPGTPSSGSTSDS
jgi:hypothetical protein